MYTLFTVNQLGAALLRTLQAGRLSALQPAATHNMFFMSLYSLTIKLN